MRRVVIAAGSIVLAAIIAVVDWLLPSVQLAYLEIFPVLALAATFGFRTGIVAAIAISVPLIYLEYAGGFRLRHSILAANVSIMATVLVFVTVIFERWQRAERTRKQHDLARSEERYRLVGKSLPGTTWTATPDGLLDHISEGAVAMDRPAESLLGPAWLEVVHPDDRERVISVWSASLEASAPYDIQFRIRMSGGVYRWHLVRALPQRDETGAIVRWVGVNVDIDDQRRAEERRAKIEIGLRALAEAGAEMYGSLDFEETLRNIAEAVAKSFATACTIDLVGEDGTYRRVAVAHPRADMRSLFERYTDTSRFTPQHPIVQAIRFGTSTCITDVYEGWTATQTPSLIDIVEMLGLRSILCVPVRAPDGSVIGALACSLDREDPRPPYVPDDIPFAEELGRRAGIAVQHARAYARERTIAMRFQEASLPSTLPMVADLRLSADYRPGNSEATIGGDWYDAFQLDDGRVAITIGDVLGKGLEAAVTMATLRQAIRGAASLLPNPCAMLGVAERTIRDLPSQTYATALAAIYDPQLREITFATAGHPGPVLCSADGAVEELIATGPMLGLGEGHAGQTTTYLPPGSTLAFFTDGLTESTRDINDGYRRLHSAIADPHVRATENPAQAIVERVLDRSQPRDDIAVLVMETGTTEVSALRDRSYELFASSPSP